MMLEGILCDRIYGCGREICEVPKRKWKDAQEFYVDER